MLQHLKDEYASYPAGIHLLKCQCNGSESFGRGKNRIFFLFFEQDWPILKMMDHAEQKVGIDT